MKKGLNTIRLLAFLAFLVLVTTFTCWCRGKIVQKLQEGFDDKAYDTLIDPKYKHDPFYPKSITEGFTISSSKNRDPFSRSYCAMYDKVFDCKQLYSEHVKSIVDNCVRKDNKKQVTFLDAGTGCGRHYQELKKAGIQNVLGLDCSENMIQRAKIRNPIGEFQVGELTNQDTFKPNQFSHIVCPMDTLYHNTRDEQQTMLANFYYWLKPNGYLALHIFDTRKLDPAPMEYSQYYHEKENGQKYAITYFDKMTHKASWEPEADGVWKFRERYIKPDGSYKEEINTFHFGDRKKLIGALTDMGYKVKTIVDYRKIEVPDHELYILQKKVGKTQTQAI